MADHITRYDKMPIPPIEAHTEYFSAGIIRIGVEFRVLNDVAVADGTNRVYQTQFAQVAQTGNYHVVLANYAGSVTSEVAVATVEPDVAPPVVVNAASMKEAP